MIISDDGIEFIAGWEKFKFIAYKDQAGIWTVGYGTIVYSDGTKVKEYDTITEMAARVEMGRELDGISLKLNNWINIRLKQHEFDALVSLSYNIGTYGFKTSTLLRKLNSENKIVEDYFTRWNKVRKENKLIVSNGLTRRRKSEWKLFSRADYTGNK